MKRTHCFIRKNTPELRLKLDFLLIKQNDFDDNDGEWLAYNYGMYISVSKGYEKLFPEEIDCGTNEDLFIALITQDVYIRIGEIPENEESKIHRGDAIIGTEKGVSVYDTIYLDSKWRIIMPSPMKEGQGLTYESLINNVCEYRYKVNRPDKIYLVTGNKVGIGSDNEPVIKNVKILSDITNSFKSK